MAQPRGEGFERERVEPGSENVEREPYRGGVEREHVAEPTGMRETPFAPMEPGVYVRPRDLMRWGPIFAGFFASLSLIVLLGVLGAAIGLGFVTSPAQAGGVAAAIWGGITLIVAFFVGGWIASRTSAISGAVVGWLQGAEVWALTTTVLLVIGAMGLAGVIGAVTGPGAPAPTTPGQGAAVVAAGAAWGTFAALILGLAAAAFGGYVGGQSLPHEREQHVR